MAWNPESKTVWDSIVNLSHACQATWLKHGLLIQSNNESKSFQEGSQNHETGLGYNRVVSHTFHFNWEYKVISNIGIVNCL